ncbi:MAG: DUF4037 domain-containing protein [Lachnospiraceae bacterium]|nr:DUF4037 domain-containing protein [Lachnospiraceae bacterium]
MDNGIISKNRRFYDEYVAPMIRSRFGVYENRIAVGIAGEGSDCFGYDDGISRDHDFGTGVCLWLTDADMASAGSELSAAYDDIVRSRERAFYTDRLRERRGVMTIHDFYSKILCIDCDTDGCVMTEEQWMALDHSCLATAVNGEVFRDDLGDFSKFRSMLLGYYPDKVWRMRIAEKMHEYSATLQVNYQRCMARGDIVAAEYCRTTGMMAAVELFFLLERKYMPYYKWAYRALTEIDAGGDFCARIDELARCSADPGAWEGTRYHTNRPNLKDRVVGLAEDIGYDISEMLKERGLCDRINPYLEADVGRVLA